MQAGKASGQGAGRQQWYGGGAVISGWSEVYCWGKMTRVSYVTAMGYRNIASRVSLVVVSFLEERLLKMFTGSEFTCIKHCMKFYC